MCVLNMQLTEAQMASLRILKTLLFLTASHHLSMVATAFILITLHVCKCVCVCVCVRVSVVRVSVCVCVCVRVSVVHVSVCVCV